MSIFRLKRGGLHPRFERHDGTGGGHWRCTQAGQLVAKASFSSASTNEAGTNMSGPSAANQKKCGRHIFPLLRIQNSA